MRNSTTTLFVSAVLLASGGFAESSMADETQSAALAHHTLLWLFALLGVPLLAGAKPLWEAIRNSPSRVSAANGREFGVLRRRVPQERKEPPTRRAA